MTKEAKALKIKSIASILVGAGIIITAFVFMVLHSFDLPSMLLLVAGGFACFLGVEAARAANVPSTVGGLMFSSGSALFFLLALAVGMWFAAGKQFCTELGLVACSFAMCLVVTLAIYKVKKLEEQV